MLHNAASFVNSNKHAASKCLPQALVRSFPVLIKTLSLRAQNFAAFGASAFDDVAAVRRLHAFAKTVNFTSLTFFWLIGSYHPNTPRFIR